MANINLTAGQNITLEQDGNNLIINGEAGGGASSDIVIISDEQPTSEDNKIWIDTGEVQNLGSEVYIGDTINSKIGLNILYSKNLFDKNNFNVLSGLISDGGTLASNSYFKTLFLKVVPSTTYTVSKISSTYFRVAGFENIPVLGASYISREKNDSATSITYTTPSNCNYLAVTYYDSNSDSNEQNILNSIQIERGSVATTYKPYITPTINVKGEDIYVKGQNEVYSTQEQVIGTWINGKPLYRKVIEASITANTSTNVATLTNIDKIVHVYGSFVTSTTTITDLNYYGSANDNGRWWYSPSVNYIRYINAQAGTLYMTVEYTKTTD